MTTQAERSAQTKKKLSAAFWQLASEEGISHVSVGSVAKLAGFNRGTFYVHFIDVNDLITQTEDEIIAALKKSVYSTSKQEFLCDSDGFMRKVFTIISEYADIIFQLLGTNGDPNFLARIQKEARIFIESLIGRSALSQMQEYIVIYITSATSAVLTYWYEHQDADIDAVIQLVKKLHFYGISPYIQTFRS